ncbi:MAG: methyl-accepting chemotaxis protein, partial [Gallionellaceae bacterium]
MKTLTLKVLVPTLAALFIGMLALGGTLFSLLGDAVSNQVTGGSERTAEFVAAVASPYVTNYDLTALGGFVKEVTQGGDTVYAEFFGEDGASLTSDVVKAPKNINELYMVERDVLDSTGKKVASFKMGIKHDSIIAAQRHTAYIMIPGILVVMLSVLLVIVVVVRRAVTPAQGMQLVLAEVAQGNLAVKAKVESEDEIGEMARSLNRMVDALNLTLSKVGSHAINVNLAAGEIADSVSSQVSASTEMSATVTEITSTMEELSASSTQIAEHSKSVVDIANHAWEISKRGAESMQLVLGKM